jgi:phage antirepressor YoqD-like protein
MLRDAAHQQAIEKFSFIHTLNLSEAAATEQDRSVSQNDSIVESEPVISLDWVAQDEASTTFSDKSNSQSSSLTSLSTTTSTIDATWLQIEPTSISPSLKIDETLFPPEIESLDRPKTNNLGRYADRILLILSCGYAIFVAWWLFGHQNGQLFAWLTNRQYISISQADAQFIQYMKRSLDNLTVKTEIAQNDKKAKKQSDQVVYVPVYTPTTTTTISSIVPEPIAPPPPPLEITPPLPTSTVTLPTPIVTKTNISQPKSIAATSVTPPINISLSGILELGQQSAALFEINGTTKRIWLGEQIDNTGWILESVSNREAKVSYQGKTRSVSVGEKF